MSPMALGLVMGAGSSNRAVRRLGTARVVTAGLTGLAVLFALTLLWSADLGAGLLLAWFFGVALSMGWVMAPATDAVVGAVPAARSGVASAMNTVARMVSGALGVAVLGSLVNSLYSDEVAGSLPPRAPEAATESIGASTSPPACSRAPATPSRARWGSASPSPPGSRSAPPCWSRACSRLSRRARARRPAAPRSTRPCRWRRSRRPFRGSRPWSRRGRAPAGTS
jgi:MFS family permease